MNIVIIEINIFTKIMIMKNSFNKFFPLSLFIFLGSCALAPGMYLDTGFDWNGENYIYSESLDRKIKIEKVSSKKIYSEINKEYKIGKGDQIAITIWGLPEVFPLTNINPEQNLRRIDSNGNIFFPFIGSLKAEGKSQNELRQDITLSLQNYFKDIQLDLTIVNFNSQKIYILGEVSTPMKINLTDIPLSLSNALGQARGLNTISANGSEVFIIRQLDNNPESAKIFQADLDSPAGFLSTNNFYLANNDIIYVNAKGTTRWNRVISQFFPFSSFLNSVDNLIDD